jgi:hypothetical protein
MLNGWVSPTAFAFVLLGSVSFANAETLTVCNARYNACAASPNNIDGPGRVRCVMSRYTCLGQRVPLSVVQAYCRAGYDNCRRYRDDKYCRGPGYNKCVLDTQYGGNVRDHRR